MLTNQISVELSEWDTGQTIVCGTKEFVADELGVTVYGVDAILRKAKIGKGALRIVNRRSAKVYEATDGNRTYRGTCDEIGAILGREPVSIRDAALKGYRTKSGFAVRPLPPICWSVPDAKGRYQLAVSRWRGARISEAKRGR